MTPHAPRSAFVDSQTGRISKYCPHCGELWPVELAFYGLDRKSGKLAAWQSWCRACGTEWRREARARRAAADSLAGQPTAAQGDG